LRSQQGRAFKSAIFRQNLPGTCRFRVIGPLSIESALQAEPTRGASRNFSRAWASNLRLSANEHSQLAVCEASKDAPSSQRFSGKICPESVVFA